MPVKLKRFLSFVMAVLPWFTIPLFGWTNFKRFFPAAFFILVFEFLNVQIGKKRRWWMFYRKPNSYFYNEFPFNIGPFIVGAMWILKWTYGDFKKFIVLNAIVDGMFAYLATPFFKKLKVVTLVRLNKTQFFFYFFYKAFLLYGLQKVIESVRRNNEVINRF